MLAAARTQRESVRNTDGSAHEFHGFDETTAGTRKVGLKPKFAVPQAARRS